MIPTAAFASICNSIACHAFYSHSLLRSHACCVQLCFARVQGDDALIFVPHGCCWTTHFSASSFLLLSHCHFGQPVSWVLSTNQTRSQSVEILSRILRYVSASANYQLLVFQLTLSTLLQRAVDLACTLELSLHPNVLFTLFTRAFTLAAPRAKPCSVKTLAYASSPFAAASRVPKSDTVSLPFSGFPTATFLMEVQHTSHG